MTNRTLHPWRRLPALATAFALIAALAACQAGPGSVEDGRRIFVPDQWNPPEIVGAKGAQVVKPASPASYRTESTGTSLGVKSVTVHGGQQQRVTIRPLKAPVEVQLEDGTILTVVRGRDTTIGKEPYKVLGMADEYLYLQNRKTRQVWRFKGIPREEAKSNATDQDNPATWQFMVH